MSNKMSDKKKHNQALLATATTIKEQIEQKKKGLEHLTKKEFLMYCLSYH